MFTASFSSDAPGPFSVIIHAPDRESSIAMLVVRDAKYQGDFTIFRQGSGAMAEFLAIGRAIVEQCERMMPEPASEPSNKPGDPVDFSVAHDPANFNPKEMIEVEGDGLDTVKIPAFDFANNVCAQCGKKSTHIYSNIFLCKEHFHAANDALGASASSEPVAPMTDATTAFQPGTRVEMHHKLGLLSGTVTLVSRDSKTARVKFDGTGDEDCGVKTSSLRLEAMPF